MLARSYLFVPGDREDRLDKALASGADAVVADLEDAVADAAKASARAHIARWLSGLSDEARARVVVRVNAEATPGFEADLQMVAAARPMGLMLPKAEQPGALAALQQACPGLALLPLVESAAGMLAAPALARAPGVHRLVFGTLDYALDLDLGPEPEALDAGHARLAMASRAAGIAPPVAGVSTALHDDDALRADWARARRHGFGAKLCIHPRQVAALHAAMQPTPEELAWAQRVLDAMDDAAAGQPGAVQLDGRMVDRPVVERARRILDRLRR